MNKGIIKCLKNSIGEKGNYCYSLPVETTKAVIKELNRLNNIINELENTIENFMENHTEGYLDWKYDREIYLAESNVLQKLYDTYFDKLQELKENK